MKFFKNSFFLLFFSIILNLPFHLSGQNLNIDETIQYINEKLNINKITDDENAEFVWEVSADGKLTITKYVNKTWIMSQSVNLKSLDTNSIFINKSNDQTDYFYTLEIACKNGGNNITKSYKRDLRISVIYLRFKPDKEVADRLKNAITYLIRKANERQDFKQ